MAEITAKRTGELLRGVFKILSDHPDGLPAREVLMKLEKEVPPTPFESSEYPKHPGVRRFEKIVRFGTVACVKAGWLEKSKGRWTLTESGIEAYKRILDPEKFKRETDRLYRVWADVNLETDSAEENEEGDSEASQVSLSFETADERAWAEIEKHLHKIDPYDFQNRLVTGLLKGMGYHVAHAAPPGADGGVDIIAYPDPLGTKEPTIKVSVRRRVQKADVKDLREFLSRIHPGEVGIFISVAGFTSEAERESRSDQRKIRLIDLERLFDLWVEHYSKIPESDRKLLAIKPVWFLEAVI
jgi:restriction system protein